MTEFFWNVSFDWPAELDDVFHAQVLRKARDRARYLPMQLALVNARAASILHHLLAGDKHMLHRIAGRGIDEIGDGVDQRLPFRAAGIEQYDIGILAGFDAADAVAPGC